MYIQYGNNNMTLWHIMYKLCKFTIKRETSHYLLYNKEMQREVARNGMLLTHGSCTFKLKSRRKLISTNSIE